MASQITNLQSEKRAAEYVIYSTALLLCLEILRVLSAATCLEYHALRSLQTCLSSVQNVLYTAIRAMRPSCGWECYLLRIALRVAVVTRYRLVKIRLIKFCKVQGKKRLTSNCLAAYLIWANTSYNTIDGLSFYLKRFPYICDLKKNFVHHFFKFRTPFLHHFRVKIREITVKYVKS